MATYLPEFAAHGKGAITVRQLLTHTSGPAARPAAVAGLAGPGLPDRGRPRRRADLAARHDLRLQRPQPDHPRRAAGAADRQQPGPARGPAHHPARWGCGTRATTPTRRSSRGSPPPSSSRRRRAAWSGAQVHDENAWSLGGVAGHAGIFSTAHDMAVLAQAMLNGGTYDGDRILSRVERRADDHQLQRGLPRRRARPRLRAGPALVHVRPVRAADRRPHRLHRHLPGDRLRLALVRRSCCPTACTRAGAGAATTRPAGWRRRDSRSPSGSAPRHGADRVVQRHARRHDARPSPRARWTSSGRRALSFDLFVDTESSDPLTLESSRDGGADVDRAAVPAPRPRPGDHRADGARRRQRQPSLAAGDGDARPRCRCRSAGATPPTPCTPVAGVFVDGVRVVASSGGPVLDGERHPGALIPQGWSPVRR